MSFFFIVMLNLVVPILFLGLFIWALYDAWSRPAGSFALASQSRKFWLVVLGIGVFYYICRVLPWIGMAVPRIPISSIFAFILIFALIYYIGPERQRMGGRPPRGRNASRGGW